MFSLAGLNLVFGVPILCCVPCVSLGGQVMARLVDARAPLLPLGYRAGLLLCKEYGDWRRAMVLMEDMRISKKRVSGESWLPFDFLAAAPVVDPRLWGAARCRVQRIHDVLSRN